MRMFETFARHAMKAEDAISRGRVLGVSEEDVRAEIRAEVERVRPTPYPFDWDRVNAAVLRRGYVEEDQT